MKIWEKSETAIKRKTVAFWSKKTGKAHEIFINYSYFVSWTHLWHSNPRNEIRFSPGKRIQRQLFTIQNDRSAYFYSNAFQFVFFISIFFGLCCGFLSLFFCSFIQFWSWILIELAVIAVLDAIKTFSTEEMSGSQWEAQPLKMYVAIPLLNEQFQTEYSYKFVNEKVIGSMVVLTTADHYGFNSKFDISGNYIKSHSQTVSIRSNQVIHTTGLMRRWNQNQHELRFGRVHCKWMWMWIEPYTFQIVSSPANSYSTR